MVICHVGAPFEEQSFFPGRTQLGSMYDPFPRGFYMEPKGVLPGTKKGSVRTKKGSPMRTAEVPISTPFFLRMYFSVFRCIGCSH